MGYTMKDDHMTTKTLNMMMLLSTHNHTTEYERESVPKFYCKRCNNTSYNFRIEGNISIAYNESGHHLSNTIRAFENSRCQCLVCDYQDTLLEMIVYE